MHTSISTFLLLYSFTPLLLLLPAIHIQILPAKQLSFFRFFYVSLLLLSPFFRLLFPSLLSNPRFLPSLYLTTCFSCSPQPLFLGWVTTIISRVFFFTSMAWHEDPSSYSLTRFSSYTLFTYSLHIFFFFLISIL